MANNFRVVYLMTTHRAGSKLFHSFLDGHPQIICFPRVLYFNKFWESVKRYREQPVRVVDLFIKQHPRFFSGKEWYRFNKFDRADQLGPNRDETFKVDEALFRQLALRELENKNIDRKLLFIALHIAYHLSCGRSIQPRSIILCHMHVIDICELEECLIDFPDSQFILTDRHPIEGLKSCVKWMDMQNSLSCSAIFFYYQQALNGITILKIKFPNLDIKLLSFELLHIYHKEVMSSLVQWLGIQWHENLMKSTLHGKLWWGNGKVPQYGSNPRWKVYRPSGFFEKKDWKIFCNFNFDLYHAYGYLTEAEKEPKLFPFFFLLLPTFLEWEQLKLILSVRYWLRCMRAIKEEITDPRLKHFDYYSKTKVVTHKSTLWFYFIFCSKLIRHVRMMNLLVFGWYVVRRVVFVFRAYQWERQMRGTNRCQFKSLQLLVRAL